MKHLTETEQTALYDAHRPGVLRYFRSRVDPHTAEDLTAETFLRAFRGTWEDRGIPYQHFLARVATNVFRGWLRKAARQVPTAPLQDHAAPHGDAAPRTLLTHASSPRQAEALRLHYVEDLPGDVAAARMGITYTAYKSLLYRGRRRIRAALNPPPPRRASFVAQAVPVQSFAAATGQAIRQLRQERDWTREDLATAMHVTASAVTHIERGRSDRGRSGGSLAGLVNRNEVLALFGWQIEIRIVPIEVCEEGATPTCARRRSA